LIGYVYFVVLGLALAVIAATFIVAFYLAVFGLPIAILLGKRIRHPLALGVSLIDAGIGALVALTGSTFGIFGIDESSPGAYALVLSFALPAGYFYRRNIIALRDHAEY
jgi:hypothetical protein